MGIGTFGSFTQARLAIYAAQTGITVTGNNISNVNTEGYTRQRLDQKSLYNAGADRYYSTTGVKVGQGVLCYGLSQLRDPYLDIQYRSKSADVGAMDGMLEGLNRIAAVLDEVGKGGEIAEGKEFGIVIAQLQEIYDALNSLTDQTGHDAYDVQVRSACDKLVTMLRSYGRALDREYDNTVMQFEQNVTKVNTLLTNIRSLNENIRQADIFGDDALEMRDERNLLIDQLSEYVKIDVSYSMESVGIGAEVEKLTIRLDNANPDSSVHTDETVLVDGIYAAQLSIDPVLNEKAYKYVEPDGTLTNNPARAMVPMENLNYGKTPGVDTMDGKYPGPSVKYVKLSADGSHYVAAASADDADAAPKENPNYDKSGENDGLLYLKADGTPTATYQEAAHSPNFDITVTELTDRNGRLLYTLSQAAREEIPMVPEENPNHLLEPDDPDYSPDRYLDKGKQPTDNVDEANLVPDGYPADGKATTEVDPATGDITITNYIKELSSEIIRNPAWEKGSTTAYSYLTDSGTGTSRPEDAAMVFQYNPNYGKKEADWDPKYPAGSIRFLKVVTTKDDQGNITSMELAKTTGEDGTEKYEGAISANDAWLPKENKNKDLNDPTGYRYIKYASKDKNPEELTINDYTNNLDEARGEPTYYKQVIQKIPSKSVKLDDNDLYGKLQAQRELLTEAGEFSTADTIENVDESALTKRGIPYYQKSLDLLAHTFATEMNKANQGYLVNPKGEFIDPAGTDGETLTFTNGNDTYTLNKNDEWADIPQWVKDGPLKEYGSVENYLAGEKLKTFTGTNADGDPETFTLTEDTAWDKVPDWVKEDPLKEYGSVKDYLEGKKLTTFTGTNADGDTETFTLTEDTDWDKVPAWVKGKDGPLEGYDSVEAYLESGKADGAKNGVFRGGNLFSNNGNSNDDDPPITASNISISLDWGSGPMVVNSFVCPTGFSEPASSDSDNIITNFTKLFYKKLEFHPDTVAYEGAVGAPRHEAMFTGTMKDMLLNISTVLGNDMSVTTTKLDNYYDAQVNLDTSRDSVSAVDFNDEAMNLMMYAKAYNAACRLMTTLDSVLDKLINNTGLLT